ncbi:DUF3180 domain-containing protein [Yinghuangia seranimata]|uniref:DUF3180 domain-containing protein n=1 Tax=Yinghuangia seranimata TaxID=408067 RepID=UPI00248AC032|nr:DUF3180 domain-containing protein [Yinghuangia seranimata]MDI2127994.1 DUF3180 domain-containing protein [Yinghuangia seranimata]
MKPTRPTVLLGVAVATGALAYGGINLWLTRGTPPGVPVLAPFVLLLLAGVALATGLALRSRFKAQRERRVDAKPVDPLTAARAVVFAKASSLVAALIAGLYGGYGLYLWMHLDNEVRRQQAARCGYSVGAAVLLVLAALFLERVCRVPEDEDKPPNGAQGSNRH